MRRESEAWSSTDFPDVVVHARSRVPILERARVCGAIGRLLARYRITGGARVRLTADFAAEPMLIQVNLDSLETPVRMQTLTRGRGDVLPAVVRLEHQIALLSGRWQPKPWPDPTRRPLSVPTAGKVVRRKRCALRAVEPLAAAALMDVSDYDAHLFIDAETGEDAIVYRAGPTEVKMARQHHTHPPRSNPAYDRGRVTMNQRTPPRLSESEATQRLCTYGLPFVFFTDPETDRGRLLYRRYDADLTLITPDPDGAGSDPP